MKTVLLLIMFFLFSSLQMKAQIQDSLIQLYKGMGDTLDFIDREMFDLYPLIHGFKFAQFYLRNNKSVVSKIYYNNNEDDSYIELLGDTSVVSKINNAVNQFRIKNEKKLKSPLDAVVYIKSGRQYDGKLRIFSKNYLFLDTDNYSKNLDSRLLHYKIPIKKIDFITIKEEKGFEKNLKYIGYGALGGGALGFVIGLFSNNYWEMLSPIERGGITGLIGLGIGAFVGFIIGEIAEPSYSEFTITFNSPNDILKLKEYSSYYFQQNKKLEEQYLELK